MNILIVSGIWPPDVGGPASHAPEVADFLRGCGHRVEVVTTAATAPAKERYEVHWVSRALPVGLRHLAAALLVARRARRNDVVYSTGMLGRTAVGCGISRRPFVAKLTQDPAFERALRRGQFRGGPVEFQTSRSARLLRMARDREVRRAARIVCPSSFLAGLVRGWGVASDRIAVIPNPAPRLPDLPEPGDVPDRAAPLLAFAGRLTAPKALGFLLEAVAEVPGVELALAGDGDERSELEARSHELGLDGRVTFLGSLPREQVLSLFRRADAVCLSSIWENFPHTLVEALAVGTPVIATRVGGVPEIVEDGANGLLVEPHDPAALAAAIRRLTADAGLRARLAAAARPSAERFSHDSVYGELERVLVAAVRR